MSNEQPSARLVWTRRIGEDWWAVILGSALIALVYVRVLAGIPW